MKIVGVPKTIDNDLSATEVTFGFDTALATATDAVDKIHTTAESHHRIMVVEVMGRDAGWIALEAGIAGGAHVILIPEIPFTVQSICELRHRPRKLWQALHHYGGGGRRQTAAGIARKTAAPAPSATRIGNAVATGANKEVRVSVLGHIQRGGSPTPFDRILGTRFGVAAVDLIAAEGFGKMVCLRSGQNRGGRYRRSHRPIENRRSSRTNREYCSRHRDLLWRLKTHTFILSKAKDPCIVFTPALQ